MIYSGETKPRVYLETTVISYLAGRPNLDARLASWQEASRQLWENHTDPILEECYRMKEEFAAKFNSLEELSAHLRKVQEECRRKGMKVVSYYVPPEKREQEKESDNNKTSSDAPPQNSSTENTSA